MSLLEIPEYAYHSDQIDDTRPSLSRSVIHAMCSRSPAHGRAAHPKLNPLLEVTTKREFDVGSSAHQVLLEGEAAVDVLAFDNWRTNASKEEAAASRKHGRIPLLEHEWELVGAMVDAVREQVAEWDPAPFTDGKAEQTITWDHEGVLLRVRPDWIRDDLSLVEDFKTASSSDPLTWSRRAIDYGYDLQAVLYRMGVQMATGAFPDYRCVVVEKQPPYLVTEFRFAPDTLALATRKVIWAIGMWRDCLETGVWPGYASETCWINLEPWHETQWLDREARWAA